MWKEIRKFSKNLIFALTPLRIWSIFRRLSLVSRISWYVDGTIIFDWACWPLRGEQNIRFTLHYESIGLVLYQTSNKSQQKNGQKFAKICAH